MRISVRPRVANFSTLKFTLSFVANLSVNCKYPLNCVANIQVPLGLLAFGETFGIDVDDADDV